MTAIEEPPQADRSRSTLLALCTGTRRACGDTCGSWGPTPPRPTTSRRRRSWRSRGPSLSSATSGRRPATCAWLPATSCWHCGASRTAKSSTVELEAADSVWAAAAGPDGSLAGYLDALRDCVEQLEGRAREAIDLHYRERAGREAIADATRNAARRREDAAAAHAASASRMRRAEIEDRNEPLTSAATKVSAARPNKKR